MTRRFFYTDPLAAAWMAKHFGMEFTAPVTGRIEPSDVGTAMFARGYVHPESLHLLEPRKGDLVEGCDPFGPHHQSGIFQIEVSHLARLDLTEANRILQRDGRPFHWPESEEV